MTCLPNQMYTTAIIITAKFKHISYTFTLSSHMAAACQGGFQPNKRDVQSSYMYE